MDVSPAVQDGKGAFIFDCETFRLETSSCERNAESLVCQARAFYPELAHWAAGSILAAVRSFSLDIHQSMLHERVLQHRDVVFLNYCYCRQTRGLWPDASILEAAPMWN